jgi:hypothetical protein
MGFNYLSGGIGAPPGNDRVFSYKDAKGDQTLTLKDPAFELSWLTKSLDFKAQISKSLARDVITPYLGIGGSTGWSRAGYKVTTTIIDSGDNIGKSDGIFNEEFGIDKIDHNGFSSSFEINRWSGRLFGGVSFTMAKFRLDLTALWNWYDNRYGVSIGGRIQTGPEEK